MRRRRGAETDPDYDPEAANHAGEMALGSITELRTRDPSDTRYEPTSHYNGSGKVGFVLTPPPKKRSKKRKRRC